MTIPADRRVARHFPPRPDIRTHRNPSAVDTDGTAVMTPTGVSRERLRTESRPASPAMAAHGGPPPKGRFCTSPYRARPAARAVVHTHSTHSVAVSCLRDVNSSNAKRYHAYYAMRVGELPIPLPRPR
jgi:ribulose-5-phosphate 4-epimerase/fuculose-1-phosphate aldolase